MIKKLEYYSNILGQVDEYLFIGFFFIKQIRISFFFFRLEN